MATLASSDVDEGHAAAGKKRPRRSTDSDTLDGVQDHLEDGDEKANGLPEGRARAGWRHVGTMYDGGRLRKKMRVMVMLGLSSTASSVALALVATRVTAVPLATLPLTASLTTLGVTGAVAAMASWRGARLEGLGDTWRDTLRIAAATGSVGALALWCKAEACGRVGLGVPLAVEVFVAPILLVLLSPLELDSATPSPRTYTTACLLAMAVAVALLSQAATFPGAVLSLLAAAFQALHYALIRRWYSRPQATSPLGVVLRSSPFAVLTSAVAVLSGVGSQNWRASRDTLGGMPKIWGPRGGFAVVLFTTLRVLETFGEAMAVEAVHGPVGVALLAPVRNLAALGLAAVAGAYIGLSNLSQLASIYGLGIAGIVSADPEVQGALRGLDEDDDEALPSAAKEASSQYRPRSQHVSHMNGHGPSSTQPFSRARRRALLALALAPLALWTLQTLLAGPDSRSRLAWRTRTGTFDVVFAYYNEPVNDFVGAIKQVTGVREIRARSPRVIIYVKNNSTDLRDLMRATGADEVNRLENYGREGGTYLTHILRHYNQTTRVQLPSASLAGVRRADWPGRFGGERWVRSDVRGVADHTLFMQPHISWHWLAVPRLDMFDAARTGYISLGPYLDSACGQDGLGNGEYERMKDIFVIFAETFCPPTKQLATYAGQYIVSRRRILKNAYTKYLNLLDLLIAPQDHWLHKEGDWFKWKGSTDTEVTNPHGPVTPFLGHALERSSPIIFQCNDLRIAKLCNDDVRDMRGKEICQCFDTE